MSVRECSILLNIVIASSVDNHKRFLHVANAGMSFVTVACRDCTEPSVCKKATLATQSFAKTLHALNNYDRRYRQKTSKIDIAHGPFDMSYNL